MKYRKKIEKFNRFKEIISFGECGLKLSTFDLLKLKKEETFEGNTGEKESAFIVLYGSCSVNGKEFNFEKIGKRKDVFSGKPSAFYIPVDTGYEIEALSDMEIAVCSSKCSTKYEPVLIGPDKVEEYNLGVLNWKRKAYFIVDGNIESENLFIGETILSPGKWAFPPHRHDIDNFPTEVDMEEIYHFRVRPKTGFAAQFFYTDDRKMDEAFLIRDGDTVIFPEGYHPAASSPVDTLYMLWVMAGKKRFFLSKPEEQYAWVKDYENVLK